MPTIGISVPYEVLERARKISKKQRRTLSNVFVFSFLKTFGEGDGEDNGK